MVTVGNVSHTPPVHAPQDLSNSASGEQPVRTQVQQAKVQGASESQSREKGFFEKVADLFKSALVSVATLFGGSHFDNSPYINLLQKLNGIETQGKSEKEKIVLRARHLFEESKKVIEQGQKIIEASKGKNAWEGLSFGDGIPMSATQQFLAGGTSVQNIMQHYYNNCAVNCLAEAISNGVEIKSFTDIDNTRATKNGFCGPEDTTRFQSKEVVFWGDRSLKIAPKLNIQETGLTARSPFDTPNIMIPEGLDESHAYAILNGGVGELLGIGEEEQLEGLEKVGLSFLSGAGNHQGGKPTYLEPALIRSYELFQFLENEDGPKFQGKTYSERLLAIAKKYGCCVQEHKTVPAYILDTFLETGGYDGSGVYLPHYIKIIQIKKECFKIGERLNKSEEEKWNDFAKAIKSNQDIKLSDSYKELIDKNPKAFYEKVRKQTIDDTCTHFFNKHGTPVKEALEEAIALHEEVAKDIRVRRKVAQLMCNIRDPNKKEADIEKFVERGIKIFKEEGVAKYLNWRLIHHFIDNYSTKEGRINNPYNKPLLQNIKLSNGESLFVIDKRNKLSFNEDFNQKLIDAYEIGGFEGYKKCIETEFNKIGLSEACSFLETFLPENFSLESLQELRIKNKEELENLPCFYPNQFHTINNKRLFDGKTEYTKIRNIISKCTNWDDLGQYYFEVQSCFDKGEVLLTPLKLLEERKKDSSKKYIYHAAGDSLQDIGMLARALESGGYCDVVFNQIRNEDIYNDIISKRLAYLKEFKSKANKLNIDALNDLYKECCDGFRIYALDRKEVNGKTKYLKVIGFKLNGKNIELIYEQDSSTNQDKLYDYSDIAYELDNKYRNKIIRNTCPEAYLRRRAETFGLLTGEDIELSKKDFAFAEALYEKREKGIVLSDEEEEILKRYERLIREDKEGFILPEEAPIISKKFLQDIPNVEGFLANKTLLKLFGRRNLTKFIKHLPNLFHGLLKYSGAIMSIGGIVRLISNLGGPFQDGMYKFGYWMSNGLRAICAIGGALRGELNVHKYHNIAFGEVINVISSLLPNGLKHLGLGLGNFVLFLGRGQQRAQIQQRVNNHTRAVLRNEAKVDSEVDSRPFVRNITKIFTDTLQTLKKEGIKSGMSSFVSEVIGNISGGMFATIQFIKDLFKKPGLILEFKERISEKAGAYYKSIPSAGHLLTAVGLLSGLSTVLGGTIGRTTRFGEDASESGFNKLGAFFVSFANAIPALGIIANAREVMTNSNGLPKQFKGLTGKDIKYDPIKAGLRQIIAGLGFLAVPWKGLHNKNVASLFDVFNGIYFLGAAEEEIPNTTELALNILRKGKLYKDPN